MMISTEKFSCYEQDGPVVTTIMNPPRLSPLISNWRTTKYAIKFSINKPW